MGKVFKLELEVRVRVLKDRVSSENEERDFQIRGINMLGLLIWSFKPGLEFGLKK